METNPKPKLILVKTPQQLLDLKNHLQHTEFLAYDCETTGLGDDCEIIGFSVCASFEEAHYVILAQWDVATQSLIKTDIYDFTSDFLKFLNTKKLIMHNAVFDCRVAKNRFGVDLMPSVHTDTMILAHLVNENRSVGLKDLAVSIFGEDSKKEQTEMHESIVANGGSLKKDNYELYKASSDLIGYYGAQDTLLTWRLLFELLPALEEEGLYDFFYHDECMPLLRGPTYDMNTTGLKVDTKKLEELTLSLEAQILELTALIDKDVKPLVKDEYPGTSKKNTFNIGSSKQLAWLLFEKLGADFNTITDSGREICKALDIKIPYYPAARRNFISILKERKGHVYATASGKQKRDKKVNDWWHYVQCGKEVLTKLENRYAFAKNLMALSKAKKLLTTYVENIQRGTHYSIIKPSFLQHGTTSGRYSSRNPNFQNLPRDDKRIKACIVARPGKVFVGADYSQLEPRVFASVSQDPALCACFSNGEDFYSVVGAPIFDKNDCSMVKKDPNSFATKYPKLRDIVKQFALATPYGTSAFQQSMKLGLSTEECEEIIEKYFAAYPKVELMMLESHEQAKKTGRVTNLFGRPRRIPAAMDIPKIYKSTPHSELPASARTLLNLAMNHRVQSTAASITNRAMIAFYNKAKESGLEDCTIVMQVHDEIIVECREKDAASVIALLKDCMETTTVLPSVKLEAEPKKALNLADLK
jgi:DNA polymerase-1